MRRDDFADRFPPVVAAVTRLPVRSRLIDDEAIACDANGLAVFDLLRRRWHGDKVIGDPVPGCLDQAPLA
jgi:ATP-dependent DNA ligase